MTVEIRPNTWYQRESLEGGVTRLWEPGVHLFFRANVFHIKGKHSDLVIDAGMGLSPLRQQLSIEDGKPVLAVATHIHVDHVGGLFEFEDRAAHYLEAPAFASMLDGDTLADAFRTLSEPVTNEPSPGWDVKGYVVRPAPIGQVLCEGDVIDLGDRQLEVIHLPGHSPGSIGLLDHDARILFSGDAIYHGQLVDDLPGGNRFDYRKTMERLMLLEVTTVFGGHRAPMTKDEMRTVAAEYISLSEEK